ncbi:hypothetical protein AB7M63_008284 [Bradyrhizobium japonicum]
MATVRIYGHTKPQLEYQLTGRALAPDLRDLLDLLGPRSLQATWTLSPVKLYRPELDAYDECFMIAEPRGDEWGRLDELARTKSSISGADLTELANAVDQVIWGEFTAVLRGQDAIWVTIRAIDSTFYEVTTTDDTVLNQIKSTFKDVRAAPGPAASTPVPEVARDGHR